MPDLINREKLLEKMRSWFVEITYNKHTPFDAAILEAGNSAVADCIRAIESAPTVDAEHVVHCKDCMEYKNGSCDRIAYIMDGYYAGEEERDLNDYCSKGVEKYAVD